jgi:hypothetical protein
VLVAALVLVTACGYDQPSATTNGSDEAQSAVSSVTVPVEPGSSTTEPNREAIIVRAISQVQAALGLPDGSVSVSEAAVPFPDAEVFLACNGGGEAALDLDTGRVVYLTSGPHDSDSGARLPTQELDAKATRLAEIMGWNAAILGAEGFTVEEAKLIDHGDAPTEYTKRWRGHDEQGVLTNGMIDAAVDASTGDVLHFLYNPGPRASLAEQAPIAEKEAIAIARGYIKAKAWPATISADSSTTSGSSELTIQGATLVHTDASGITGGREMLVWVVSLGGATERGEATATVYLDATSGEVLTWTTAG